MSETQAAAAECHLLVADFFPGGGAAPYHELKLPALETLFARGALLPASGRASLEQWLAAEFSVTAHLAAASLRGEGIAPGAACWLRADPVHLRADRDRVLLADASCFEIDEQEAAALIAALNGHFAEDGLEFIAPSPQRWYVSTREDARVRTVPTPEVRGRAIDGRLPEGEDGTRWRRIGNEAQMLLHNHPCNEAREARGALPVNSVWFWGAGRMSEAPCNTRYGTVWTSHPLAAGLAAGAGLAVRSLPPTGGLGLETGADGGKPELMVLPGPGEALGNGISSWRRALEELETLWVAPLLARLRSGAIQALALHGLGPERQCLARATRHSLLKFWRRRRPLGYYTS